MKKHERQQMYYCKKCDKKFTSGITRNRTFPLRVILDSLTTYNRLNSLEVSAKQVSEKYGLPISFQNISNWCKDFHSYAPFLRIRDAIAKTHEKRKILVESSLFHGQVYDFKYHRAKTDWILNEDPKNSAFAPLQDYLEQVVDTCPHQTFKDSTTRSSQYKGTFNLEQVKITRKDNAATKLARFILQAVANNKLRHEILQEFMLINDSVTVATEVPILLTAEDVQHFKKVLHFDVPINLKKGEVITGHIDLIQIRNGEIHILDFKPNAKREKPIEQLMIYALALSRLTNLRLFDIKCAWFDGQDYFEFFPLHVVYKKKKKGK